jgi:hypothetical protein
MSRGCVQTTNQLITEHRLRLEDDKVGFYFVTLLVPSSLRVVLGERNIAGQNELDVIIEQLVMAAHLVGRLAASNGAGHLVPAVGRVLAVVGEGLFKQLVLLFAPRGVHVSAAGRRASRPRHLWIGLSFLETELASADVLCVDTLVG